MGKVTYYTQKCPKCKANSLKSTVSVLKDKSDVKLIIDF